jgi:transcriptional/translational regulatory protein YebC/TACO1
MFMFDRKGVVHAKGKLSEETELALIDAGAEDIDTNNGIVSVTTSATKWTSVRDALKNAGLEVQDAGLKYIAKTEIPITDKETAQRVLDFIEQIEEDEDVSEVHTNADIADEIIAQL